MKKKKIVVIVLAIIVALTALYIITPGFSKQGNVYIADFSASEDGTEMTITIGVSSSIGYVRNIAAHQQQGGKLYLDCYSAFGGINGSLGRKTSILSNSARIPRQSPYIVRITVMTPFWKRTRTANGTMRKLSNFHLIQAHICKKE